MISGGIFATIGPWFSMIRNTVIATLWVWFLLLCPAVVSQAMGATYYVDASSGSDSNAGTSPTNAWQTISKVNTTSLLPGDSVLFKRGQSWSAELDIDSDGASGNPIIIAAFGSGENPIVFRVTLRGDFLYLANLIVDHNKQSGDALRIRGGRNCHLDGLVIRNGLSDGIDVDKADGLIVENTLIHHFLAGSFSSQADAHGIVATETNGILIRNVEVHHVSGDSFQADPNRSGSNNIIVENSHFWTSPLSSNFNGNWLAGERPGENAIDTKVASSNIDSATRMVITIRNVTAHGWLKDGFISNKAVFNMKEKIEAVFDGVTVYDAEIAFRLRGTRGNANVTIRNGVIYDVEKAIRAEDDLAQLVVQNATFGDGILQHLQFAGGAAGTGSWDWRNNAFINSKPAVASDSSNVIATASDFQDSALRDYHLRAGALLIERATTIAEVSKDRDAIVRTVPYDVGAYEFSTVDGLPPAAPSSLRLE